MVRSNVYVVVLCALSLCIFAYTGSNAGGPPVAPGGRAGQWDPGVTPGGGPTGAEGATTSPSFSVSGGAGSGTINGGDGSSPSLSFKDDVTLANTFLYNLRAAYILPPLVKFPITVYGDIYRAQFSGSQGSARSVVSPSFPIAVGDNLSVDYDVNMWAVTGDFSVLAMAGMPAAISGGFRLQFCDMYRSLKSRNTTAMWASEQTNGHGMFGYGAFLVFKSESLIGRSLTSSYGSANPALMLAGTVGQGGAMRYWEVEAMLGLIQTSGDATSWLSNRYIAAPALNVSFGYCMWAFKETLDRPIDFTGLTTTDADFQIGYFLGRVAVAF